MDDRLAHQARQLIGAIAHACELVPDTTAFARMPAHIPHSVRHSTGRGCETHACKPDKLTRDAGHDNRIPFSPLAATPLDVPKFLHSKLHTNGFVGAGGMAAASLPVAWGQLRPISTGRSIATRLGFAASMEAPSPRPTSRALPDGPRSSDGSIHSHGGTVPGNAPGFPPARDLPEIPSYLLALRPSLVL